MNLSINFTDILVIFSVVVIASLHLFWFMNGGSFKSKKRHFYEDLEEIHRKLERKKTLEDNNTYNNEEKL